MRTLVSYREKLCLNHNRNKRLLTPKSYKILDLWIAHTSEHMRLKNQRFLNVIVNGMTGSERIRSQALRYKLLNFNHKIF